MRLSGVGLTCIRGGREVFSGLDFQVGAGEALAVTGRNGAGKSSLLRLIAGLLQPAKGRIALDHGGPENLPLSERTHYLGHRDPFKPSLTVLENLGFWRDFLGGEPAEIDASLAAAGLGHTAHLPAVTLSAGQRRRLSIARLVVVRRPVWLLDEPTSALDTDGRTMFSALMSDHLAGGGIIVAATHEPLVVGPSGPEARTMRIGEAA